MRIKTSHPNLFRADAAFTLTELLVVLLLIGILTGVMVVEMRG
ncbi:MAG: prepilin-type N-terminal cleavage/methylation domain-containing protein, partial [Limisphaerales bacterium]